jgi:hypothetical protein
MLRNIQSWVQSNYRKRHALNVLAVIRCTSWVNQERIRNCCCHVASYPTTSIRWSSSHHRDAHCSLSLSPLSGPSHHTDCGSLLSPSRHGRRDTRVCTWIHVQSFLWQIWLEIRAWLNLLPIMFLWKVTLLPLPFWLPLLSSILLIFSVLQAFSSLLLFQLPPSSSLFILFLARLTAKLTPIGQLFPWGLWSLDGPLEPAW